MNRLPEEIFYQRGLDCFGVCGWDGSLCRIPCRAVKRLPETPKSIIAAAFPYYVGSFPYRNVSRYALPLDYHDVAQSLLREICAELSGRFPGERFEPFCDISPIDEVEAGRRAGLGDIGENGLLINPRYGSYFFIGEIAATVQFPESRPGGRCPGCGACREACPGGALRGGGFRRESCLSFLTQKKRLDPGDAEIIRRGGMVWGCDVCSDVCPLNRRPAYTPLYEFYRNICARVTNNNLRDALPGRAYAYRGLAVPERNLLLLSKNS